MRRAIAFAMLAIFASIGIARAESPFSFSTTPGKLPKTVVPTHYAIDLKPDLKTLALNGVEVIDIKVSEPTDRLVLNAMNIAFESASLDGEVGQTATVALDAKAQTATVGFPHRIEAGAHKLRIIYRGRINSFGQGLFYVDYPTSAGRKRMISSQNEPADARRIFPCWDEPAFKATFEPKVTVPENFLAVSNMPIVHEQKLGDGTRRVDFGASPPMSSYLFVLAAGELERLSADVDGITIGVVTTAGKREQGKFALQSASDLMRYYNDYFGIKYPLPKLDLIAVPGGFGGAMENWGGITFFESSLLYDPASSPKAVRRSVFSVVAHEMAHQWFGDLVTTAWWNDLWLNEGFATWMQMKVEEQLHPDWEVFLNSAGEKQAALGQDARSMTHPIQQPVTDESEATNAFDAITYSKGAALIREIESYVGDDKFRDGIREYLKAHAYSNATTADLWSALEHASGKPVASIAAGYTEQPGEPLISVVEKCVGDRKHLLLKQEPFTIHYHETRPLHWMVPIAIGVAGAKQPSQVVLLRDTTMDLDAGKCGDLLKLNLGDVGYYRVQYDDATAAALAKSVEAMAPADRVNLLSDTWALVQAGRVAPPKYLELLDAIANDDKRAVWQRAMATIDQIDHLERGSSHRAAFQQYARTVLQPPFQRLSWNSTPDEPEDNTILRSNLISTLGSLNDPDIVAQAKRRFAGFLKNPASLDVNLRDPVIAIVGRTADRQTYDTIHALARSSTNTHERSRYYFALASAIDPDLVEETLHIALTDELPTVLADYIILDVAAGEHPELALGFVKANFDALAAKRGPDFRNFFVSSLMANFTDRAHAAELEHFAPVHETPGGRIAAARAVATILEAADFREHQLVAIDAWIAHHPLSR